MRLGRGGAQQEVPLLCFVLMIQWERAPWPGRGIITRLLANPTAGRAPAGTMIYDAIIAEIAKLVPKQSFIRQSSHMTGPLHAFVRRKTLT